MLWCGGFYYNVVEFFKFVVELFAQKIMWKYYLWIRLPRLYKWAPKTSFTTEYDPKHTSKLAKEFFAEKDIEAMNWPAQPPVLNLIDNL